MRNLTLLILILSGGLTMQAQTREIEEMWNHLLDSTKIDFRHPAYISISTEEVLQLLDLQPSFGMYRDNYFITGVPTNKRINKFTADAKYQISIRQRLTKTFLPFNSFLMLTYTQKSFWDIFAESAPFADSNYNPGLMLAKPIITGNKLRGMASFAFEHESNGKDSSESRDCNYFVLTGIYFFNASLSVQGKLWAGFLGENNKDLWRKYRGYSLVALNYRSLNDRFWISAVITPYRKTGNFNTQLELNYKLSPKANQYLFFQWYQGYGESLLDYNKYSSMVRVGMCIKPPLRNLY
jgi:phospholipase A1